MKRAWGAYLIAFVLFGALLLASCRGASLPWQKPAATPTVTPTPTLVPTSTPTPTTTPTASPTPTLTPTVTPTPLAITTRAIPLTWSSISSADKVLQLGLPPNWIIVPANDKTLGQIAKLYPNDPSWQQQVDAARKVLASGRSVLALSLRRHQTENKHYLAPTLVITEDHIKTTATDLIANLLATWKRSQEIQMQRLQEVYIAGIRGVLFRIDIRQKNPDGTIYHVYMQSALLPLDGRLYSITLNDAAPAKAAAEETFMSILRTLHLNKQP